MINKEINDAELIRMVQADDEQAFNLLYERYVKLAYYIAFRFCNNDADSQDVVQETFLEAYRKADILIDHPNVMGWLYTTVKNKMMKMGSKREEHCLLDEAFNYRGFAEGKGDGYKEIELAETIKSAVSEEEYEMLCDYYVNGYSSDEVAEKYGIDKGVIRMRISRMKKKLKENVILDWIIFLICIWGLP